jgi:hypothetical protein
MKINQMESIGLQGHLHLVRIVRRQCPVYIYMHIGVTCTFCDLSEILEINV